MNVSQSVLEILEKHAVEYIFGIAGEENLYFMEELRKSKIKYIPVRHEQSAGFMAATVGRLTGKVGVALSTLGPGATNFFTSVAYAKLGAMPCLFITGQKPLRDNKQGNFQMVDIEGMMAPIVKKTSRLHIPDNTQFVTKELIRAAEEERPGPVHLEIPKDISKDELIKETIELESNARRPIAEQKSINMAVEMIRSSSHPVVLIGASANRKSTSKMLTYLIDQTGIYFIDTQMGKGIVDEYHEKFLGTAVLTAGDPVHEALDESDLIINVGHDVIEKSPFVMSRKIDRKVIHINYFGAEVHNNYYPQLEVIGDIANSIWQLSEALKETKYKFSKGDLFQKVRQNIQDKIYAKTEFKKEKDQIDPRELAGVIRNYMDDSDILTLDNGMFKLWFARYYRARKPNTILLDNALATMGAGLPSGIAAKMLNPDKKVIVLAGDGGFMMNSQELETAIRLKLDLIVIVLNDNQLGMIRWEQREKSFDEFGLSHGNPDFVKYAEAYGAIGHKVTKASELAEALKRSHNSGGVNLIEVMIDYSDNMAEFSQ